VPCLKNPLSLIYKIIQGGGIIPLQEPNSVGPVSTSKCRGRPLQLLVVPGIRVDSDSDDLDVNSPDHDGNSPDHDGNSLDHDGDSPDHDGNSVYHDGNSADLDVNSSDHDSSADHDDISADHEEELAETDGSSGPHDEFAQALNYTAHGHLYWDDGDSLSKSFLLLNNLVKYCLSVFHFVFCFKIL
jgi:hypothetical protein